MKKADRLRSNPQNPTKTFGDGDLWWWYEDRDGIRVFHQPKDFTGASMAFFTWAKIKGALSRKEGK